MDGYFAVDFEVHSSLASRQIKIKTIQKSVAIIAIRESRNQSLPQCDDAGLSQLVSLGQIA
jgi:hypothetical protein